MSAVASTPALRRLLYASLAVMVILRLLPVLLIEVQPTSDTDWYYQRAIDLVTTGQYAERGIATAFWPVGYPGFLAGLMVVFGNSVLVGQIGNLALSMVCAFLMYRLCLRQFGDARIATFAVGLLAVYPNHIGYTVGLYSEPLFTTLLLGVCLLVRPDARANAVIVAGMAAGLATLVKTQMLLLAPLLFFILSLREWTWLAMLPALRRSLLAAFVMVVTIAPWTWRNQVVMGAFVPVSTNGGMSLLAGNNPAMTMDLRTDYAEDRRTFERVNFSVDDQVAADGRARAAAWGWIRDNPLTFLSLMPKKFARFWLPDGESEWTLQRGFANYEKWQLGIRALRVMNQIYYFALLFGFLVAVRHCVRLRDPQTLAPPMAMLFFTALSLVFSGQSRYHAPLMPFVISYAAWTLARLWPAR